MVGIASFVEGFASCEVTLKAGSWITLKVQYVAEGSKTGTDTQDVSLERDYSALKCAVLSESLACAMFLRLVAGVTGASVAPVMSWVCYAFW